MSIGLGRRLLAGFALLFLAAESGAMEHPAFKRVEIDQGRGPAVDSFLFIVDASRSMAGYTHGQRKVDVAVDAAQAMAASIPELSYRAGVRSFGQGRCLPDEPTTLIHGMGRYSRASTAEALAKVRCAGRRSPLSLAFRAAARDLGEKGRGSAVFVLSDGLDMGEDDIAAARDLHRSTGACIYAVQVGRDQKGRKLLERVVSAAGCGSTVEVDDLAGAREMRELITTALFTRGREPDQDGDGVADSRDRCPNTPRGELVDEKGCPLPEAVMSGEVLFASGSDVIHPAGKRSLERILEYLHRNPDRHLRIEGHTDDRGAEKLNKELSERRAEAAKAYFVSRGIDARKISTRGFGESKPVAPNDSPANRAKNRRIEFKVED